MTWASSRLEYLRGFMTRGEIQSVTGIHWKTQEAILKGTVDIATEFKNPLRNLYGRVAYSEMRVTGFSVSQASRFRYSDPTVMSGRINTVSNLVKDLAKGSLSSQIEREGVTYTTGQYASKLSDRIESVLEGMQQSTKVYEQWIDEYTPRVKM